MKLGKLKPRLIKIFNNKEESHPLDIV